MIDQIRLMTEADAGPLAQLMHRAIREGAAGAYSSDQLEAWSPNPYGAETFAARVSGQTVLVAEDEHGAAGFFTLSQDGLLDLAHVRPDRKGDGLAVRLHDAVLTEARRQGLSELRVEASHLARRFLEKQGWSLVRSQIVHRDGVAIENHRMRRVL